jgi:hypothetical protein
VGCGNFRVVLVVAFELHESLKLSSFVSGKGRVLVLPAREGSFSLTTIVAGFQLVGMLLMICASSLITAVILYADKAKDGIEMTGLAAITVDPIKPVVGS